MVGALRREITRRRQHPGIGADASQATWRTAFSQASAASKAGVAALARRPASDRGRTRWCVGLEPRTLRCGGLARCLRVQVMFRQQRTIAQLLELVGEAKQELQEEVRLEHCPASPHRAASLNCNAAREVRYAAIAHPGGVRASVGPLVAERQGAGRLSQGATGGRRALHVGAAAGGAQRAEPLCAVVVGARVAAAGGPGAGQVRTLGRRRKGSAGTLAASPAATTPPSIGLVHLGHVPAGSGWCRACATRRPARGRGRRRRRRAAALSPTHAPRHGCRRTPPARCSTPPKASPRSTLLSAPLPLLPSTLTLAHSPPAKAQRIQKHAVCRGAHGLHALPACHHAGSPASAKTYSPHSKLQIETQHRQQRRSASAGRGRPSSAPQCGHAAEPASAASATGNARAWQPPQGAATHQALVQPAGVVAVVRAPPSEAALKLSLRKASRRAADILVEEESLARQQQKQRQQRAHAAGDGAGRAGGGKPHGGAFAAPSSGVASPAGRAPSTVPWVAGEHREGRGDEEEEEQEEEGGRRAGERWRGGGQESPRPRWRIPGHSPTRSECCSARRPASPHHALHPPSATDALRFLLPRRRHQPSTAALGQAPHALPLTVPSPPPLRTPRPPPLPAAEPALRPPGPPPRRRAPVAALLATAPLAQPAAAASRRRVYPELARQEL